MDQKKTLQEIESKKMKPVDFIYLGVIVFSFIITAILFFFSTNFIVDNINKIFLPTPESTSQPLDITRYSLIEKRLNLPVNVPGTKSTSVVPVETPTVSNIVDPSTATVALDNKSLTINILNGSRKVGVATLLSNTLEKAGFSKASTGDSPTAYVTTTIFIKDGKKEFTKSIQDAVKKLYPKAVTKVNPVSSTFDVEIITGK
jgi:hypothetical protein